MSETPILVGICELEQRIDDPLSGAEPIELMIDAVRQAAADAGCPKLLGTVSSIRVVRGRYVSHVRECPALSPARVN